MGASSAKTGRITRAAAGAGLATGAAAAPVVGAGLVANQLYERFGEDQG